MEWRDEKTVLLATIRRQEQEATALARRFKLLQQTLKEQQKLLDRYQQALGAAKSAPKAKDPKPVAIDRSSKLRATKNKDKDPKSGGIDKNIKSRAEEINVEDTDTVKPVNTTKPAPAKPHAASTWMKRKTADFSDLVAVAEAAPVQNETQEKKKKVDTAVFKPNVKRRSGGLAATWAEEKKRIQKKLKWEEVLTGSDKENVATASKSKQKESRTGFAYVEVVRNREERKALPAHDCVECTKYYDALGGLGAVEAAAQKNKCSRHRARFEPYHTPDDFWRLSFPDSEPEPRSPSVI